jgi:AraC-like DNA-binding protein
MVEFINFTDIMRLVKAMNISGITVTSIQDIVLVSSRKNKTDKMICRSSYGISLCKSGRIEYNHNGKIYISKPNNVVILPRYQTYEINRVEPGEFPVINFQTLTRFTDEFCVLQVNDNEKFIRLFEEMRKIKFEPDYNHLKMMKAFYHFLDELIAENIYFNKPVQKYVDYMNMNFNNPDLTISEIASNHNISEIYLRKLFGKYLRVSPKQYLLKLRISKSKELLESTNLSVTQISSYCGYATVYHFCRSFKNHCNCTPSEYRKMTQTQII